MYCNKLFRVDFVELWWMWLRYNPLQLVMGVRTQGTMTGCWDYVGIVGKRSNSTPFLWSLGKIINIVNTYNSIYPIVFITKTAITVANDPKPSTKCQTLPGTSDFICLEELWSCSSDELLFPASLHLENNLQLLTIKPWSHSFFKKKKQTFIGV